jgi:hypothetical protein
MLETSKSAAELRYRMHLLEPGQGLANNALLPFLWTFRLAQAASLFFKKSRKQRWFACLGRLRYSPKGFQSARCDFAGLKQLSAEFWRRAVMFGMIQTFMDVERPLKEGREDLPLGEL